MGLDDLINLFHQADSFVERDDNFLVVGDVALRQRPALSIFEPLLANLVAADVEVPNVFANAFEAGSLCFVKPHDVLRPRDFFDLGTADADELRDGVDELGRFQQVQGGEFAAEPGQRAEQLQVPGQRQAREI